MKAKKYFFLLSFIFIFDSHAYEIINETITVTPGCEGGVLYSKVESGEISNDTESSSEENKEKEDSKGPPLDTSKETISLQLNRTDTQLPPRNLSKTIFPILQGVDIYVHRKVEPLDESLMVK